MKTFLFVTTFLKHCKKEWRIYIAYSFVYGTGQNEWVYSSILKNCDIYINIYISINNIDLTNGGVKMNRKGLASRRVMVLGAIAIVATLLIAYMAYIIAQPNINYINDFPDPIEVPGGNNITANITDADEVYVEIYYPNNTLLGNFSMTPINTPYASVYGVVTWYFNSSQNGLIYQYPMPLGVYTYIVKAYNLSGWSTSSSTFTVQDTTPPTSSVDSMKYWYNSSPITITATASDNYAVANVSLWYRYSTDNSTWGAWKFFGKDSIGGDGWSWNFNFPDGEGYYEFYTIANDTAGNTEAPPVTADENAGYDITPPITTKVVGIPSYGSFVTSNTPIWLNATDNANGSGVNATYYRIWNATGWHPSSSTDYYCGNTNIIYNGTAYWYVYRMNGSVVYAPIHFHEECMHMIEYYSVDFAGNEEQYHIQTHFVDNTPPEVTKEYGEPFYNDSGNHYITKDTPIYLNATDMPDNITKLSPGVPMIWPFWIVNNINSLDLDIHNFYYQDASIGDVSYINLSSYVGLQDLTWRNMIQNYSGWNAIISGYTIPSGSNYLKSLSIDPTVSAVIVRYNVSVNGEIVARFIGEVLLNWSGGVPLIVGTLTNFDVLNNYSHDVNNFELEINGITPLNITDWFEGWGYPPTVEYDGNWLNITWKSSHGVQPGEWVHFGLGLEDNISVSDISAMRANWTTTCAVGSYIIWYRVWNDVTGWSGWYSGEENSSVVFTLAGIGDNYNCTHYIEYYAIDDLGNNYTTPLNQTVYVDNSPTESVVEIGEPSYYDDSEPMWYVKTTTPIWINTSENYSDSNTCDSGCQYLHWEAYIWNESSQQWQSCNVSVWNGSGYENRSSGNETSNKLLFHFNEESHHKIVYWGVDNVSNVETRHEIEIKVDDTPPSGYVSIGIPSAGNHLTTHTDIQIIATDGGECPVGGYYIRYNIWNGTWEYDINAPDTWPTYHNTNPIFHFNEECKHYLLFNVSDELGNWQQYNYTFYVDDTPPTSTISPANHSFVSTSTPIIITATDGPASPCATGVREIDYRILIWNDTISDWEVLQNWTTGGSAVTFYFNEQCMHKVEYYAIDSLENKEALKWAIYYVDTTPPSTSLEAGNPNVAITSNKYFVTSNTPIWLNASDAGCNNGSGVAELHYRIIYGGYPYDFVVYDNGNGDLNSSVGNISVKISFNEECNHTLIYWAVDYVGNVEGQNKAYFYVDNSPPMINLTIGEPQYNKSGMLFITSHTPIWVNATDTGLTQECTVGSVHLNVKVHWLIEGPVLVQNQWNNVTNGWASLGPIYIGEECIHWINITAIDDLNNTAYYNYTVYVDNTPPVLQKEIGEPKYIRETALSEGFEGAFPPDGWQQYQLGESNPGWTQTSTRYHNGSFSAYHDDYIANCDDWLVSPQFTVPEGGKLVFWDYTNYPSWYYYQGVWISTGSGDPSDGDFVELEEISNPVANWTKRVIDLSGYAGQNVYIAFRYQGNFATEWFIDDVMVLGRTQYITSQTPIYLNITDGGIDPCIVGSLHVKVGIYNGTWNYTWYNSSDSPLNLTIFMHEECMHWLNITMYDDLGNVAYDNETFYVDDSPPEGSINIHPYVQEAPLWVNVTAFDMPECAASGIKNVTLYYRYSCNNATWTEWQEMNTITIQPYSWYFEALQPGFYQFYAVMYDNLGHANVTRIAKLAVPLNITYTLHKGWNLITVPINVTWRAWDLANYINTHNNLSSNGKIVTTIVMLNESQQHIGWVTAMPDKNNFTIYPGIGYWVYVNNNITVRWYGKAVENMSIELHAGYNLIGWISECNMNTNTSNILAAMPNATMIIGFNTTIPDYVICIAFHGVYLNSFDINIGDGFYIFLQKEGTWTGRD